MMNEPLHKIWWFWIPVLFAVFQAGMEYFLPGEVLSAMLSENGPHELLQFFIMAAAFVTALRVLRLKPWQINPWLGVWVLLAALCCFYVAGEELSWGQQILKWNTPEYWSAVNDQNETNLHNTSSWFDQKPRLILLIGVVVGGMIIPALRKYRPGIVPEKFAIIYPPASLGMTAFLTLGVKILSHVDNALKDVIIMARSSEVVELYLFYFVLLYLIVLRCRVLQHQS